MHTRTNTYTHTLTLIQTHTLSYIHTHTHTHTLTHTHTHTHTHTRRWLFMWTLVRLDARVALEMVSEMFVVDSLEVGNVCMCL